MGLARPAAERLVRTYGSNVEALYERMPDPRTKSELHGMPQELLLMLSYAIDEEMAVTPSDFWYEEQVIYSSVLMKFVAIKQRLSRIWQVV